MNRTRTLAAVLGVVALLGACGGGAKHVSTSKARPAGVTGSSSSTTLVNYHPKIDPATFSTQITNKYFPLKPGTTFVLEGTRDGQPQRAEVVVTSETKVIMGVTTVVVRDTVTSNGALVEKTTDWYAQASNGDVWYFGEDTKEYTNGTVSSTHGTWEAGLDGAQPGIIMKAKPTVGDAYRQEYRPAVAEDFAKVLRIHDSMTVPAGSYKSVVVTEDTDLLDATKHENKYYAPGVGFIGSEGMVNGHHEISKLTKILTG
jgi:hypothetical protein